MTDAYWNGGAPSTGAIANNDGDGSSDYDGAAPHGDEPYGDSYSDTLADVAMYYYERDLSGLDNEVPTNPTDSATHQHMVTYTVAFGVSGNLNPDDYDLESGPYPTWPDPTLGNAQKIDDVWHAAVNGRGKYLSAFNSGELVDALLAIKQNIESRTGSAASVSVNGVELYEEVGWDLYMFQSTYDSDGWTGDVKAYEIDTTTGQVITSSYVWSAADQLENVDWNNRIIATYDGSAGKPFRFDSLTPDQKTDLDENWQIDDTNAENILKFLRGQRDLEQPNGAFRDRFSVLGDVVHSSPVFENGVLYTGGNDGMLHAFSATTGSEIFAYIPNLVFENLKNLADPTFHGNHTYYVDLSPAIQPGVVQGASTMTLLVGGLGKGGNGYYALDISDPASLTTETAVANKVLWEYPNSATPVAEINDVGYSYARPAIVNSQAGWIVIVGNGTDSQHR
jgi:Tfp pilus tip-associated adhesin PilY1